MVDGWVAYGAESPLVPTAGTPDRFRLPTTSLKYRMVGNTDSSAGEEYGDGEASRCLFLTSAVGRGRKYHGNGKAQTLNARADPSPDIKRLVVLTRTSNGSLEERGSLVPFKRKVSVEYNGSE